MWFADPPLALLAVGWGLAAAIGFAAHRASLCSVKAVEEILTTRRAFMLGSFARSVLWVAGITLLVAWLAPAAFKVPEAWPLTTASLVGGLVFGVGATVNGGCAVSTLTRLGDGNLGMLVSLAGFLLGIAASLLIAMPTTLLAAGDWVGAGVADSLWQKALAVVLGLWMLRELRRLSRGLSPRGLPERLVAPRYRLSTSAALIGLCNALLYGIFGVWAYSGLLRREVLSHWAEATAPPIWSWSLFAAVLIGMILSAVQGRRFCANWRPAPVWAAYGGGGFLMGLGSAWVPGGNDVLILHAIPTFAANGLPALASMFVGIAATLLLLRLFGRDLPRIDCAGDICRS